MPPLSLGTILDDFHARWARGESPRAEEYINLIDSREDAVELVYREYCLAEEAGLEPDPVSYVTRFSALGPSLSRLFRLHEAFTTSQLRNWSEPTPLPSEGDEIGPYFLMRELGRGGFARVFLASQEDLDNRLVVVKIANRVTHEPRMLARLHHPNIVEIHWHGDVNDGEFQLIVMPFQGGATLSAVLGELRREGKPPRSGAAFLAALDRIAAPERHASSQPRTARAQMGASSYPRAMAWMVARLAEALDHAYDRGVAHGDIKPSNVLVTADGDPMLLDFNLAAGWRQHTFGETLDDPGGTLAYMAPERLLAVADAGHTISTRPLDRHRADIYGLGVVLLEALCGRAPGLPKEKPPSPRDLAWALAEVRMRGSDALIRQSRAAIPATLRAILARCLAPDPADRYSRASALATDLDCWLRDRPLEFAEQPKFRPRFALWLQRHRVAVAVAGLVVATAAAVAYTRVVDEAARRRAREHAMSYFDRSDSGIFRFRRFDLSRVLERGDPADNAWRHLVDWGVDQPEDWRSRDDYYYLPAREQEELSLWLAEQALRYAHAIESKNPGSEHWNRALSVIERMGETVSAAPLQLERWRLMRHLGRPEALTPSPPTSEWGWSNEYLSGVAEELRGDEPHRELEHFQAALRERPDSFWGHYRAATVAFRLRDYRSAVEHLQLCLKQHPRNPALWGQLAGCLYQVGRFDEALEACNTASALDPSQAEIYLSRSFIRKRMGQDKAQLDDIREYERLGRLRGEAGRGAGRFRGFPLPFGSAADRRLWDDGLPKRILAVDPENIDARLALAYQWMYDKHDIDRAIVELSVILDICPDYLVARYARATLRQMKDDRDGATEDFAEFVKHDRVYEFFRECPVSLRAFHVIASNLVRNRQYAEALEVARKGLAYADRIGEQQAESHYSVARCHSRAAASEPAHYADAWSELAAMTACPSSLAVRERFETDDAFAPLRSVLRLALSPWEQPRSVGP
ncbi:MAG: protein kinase [Isosphaeraceae bacterium]|nr:protein kinase [Isosphaeraceae bacterium]